PNRTADEVRTRDQPENRQGSGPHHPTVAAAPSRSGHRVIHRRTFLCALTLGTLATPFGAEAQQAPKSYRIGSLEPGNSPGVLPTIRTRLESLGWTIQYEARYAEGRPERFPVLAADLVRSNVDVLVTVGSHATKAAQNATSTIPIVFIGVFSPVEAGVVA